MSIGTLIKYGAVTAKARAMFGNRLKEEDYRALSAAKTLAEVNSYIKYKTVYGSLLENEDEKELHRERLEKLLRTQLDEDYKRLSNFISGEKKKSLDTYRMQREVNFILTVLRGLRNGTAERRTEFIGTVLSDGGEKLKKEIVELLSANTTDEFFVLLEKTSYAGSIDAEDIEKLDYATIETLLTGKFYSSMFSVMAKELSATDLRVIKSQLGTQMDIKNICRIVRLRKSFPTDSIEKYMLPYGKRLNADKLKRLYSAQDFGKTLSEICPYYTRYVGTDETKIPNEYEISYSLNRVILMSGQPSVAVPIAYLTLKDIEIRNLIHIAEGVRYGLSQERITASLCGLRNNRSEQRPSD